MNVTRRILLRDACRASALAVMAAAGLLRPERVLADDMRAGFSAARMADAMSALGASGAVNSSRVRIKAPTLVEANAGVVMVEVIARFSKVESIALLSDASPRSLLARFDLFNLEGYLSTHIRMGSTGKVRAVVKADGKFYTAEKEIKVSQGGYSGAS